MGAFAGGFGGAVLGRAVIEIVADNTGVEQALTRQQRILAGLAVAGFGGAIVAATSYETAMARVQKTTNATEEELAALNAQFRAQSREIPLSAQQLAVLGATAAQLGVETENIAGFTDTVAKLGTATNIVGEQGAQDLARFINVAGETTGAADRISSSIVDLGNNSATTENEILQMALRVAAAGRQLGMTTGDVLGLSAAMSSLGIRPEAGGTAISRVILDIFSASQKGAQGLREYAAVADMTVEQYQHLLETDPVQALMAFIEGLGTAEQRGLNVVTMLERLSLGGVRVRDVLLRMAGAQDLVSSSVDRGNRAYEENTALQKEFETFARTLENQLRLLRNQVMDAAIGIGENFVPALRGAAGAAAEGVEAFNALPRPVRNAVLAFLAMVTLGPAVQGMLGRTAGRIAAVTAAASASQLSLAGVTRALGPMGVAGVIAGLGFAVDGVLTATTGHGIIDWLFRDPKTADAARRTVEGMRREIEALERVLGRPATEEERLNTFLAEVAPLAREAELRLRALREATGGAQPRLAEVQVAVEEAELRRIAPQVQAAVEEAMRMGVAFDDIRERVESLPAPLRRIIEGTEQYGAALAEVTALEQQAADTSEFLRGAVNRGWQEQRTFNDEVDEGARALQRLSSQAMATKFALDLMLAQDAARGFGAAFTPVIEGVTEMLRDKMIEALRQVLEDEAEIRRIVDELLEAADPGGVLRDTGGGGSGATTVSDAERAAEQVEDQRAAEMAEAFVRAGGGVAGATAVDELRREFDEIDDLWFDTFLPGLQELGIEGAEGMRAMFERWQREIDEGTAEMEGGVRGLLAVLSARREALGSGALVGDPDDRRAGTVVYIDTVNAPADPRTGEVDVPALGSAVKQSFSEHGV